MIKLAQLITERTFNYGCIMAKIDEDAAGSILDFNYKIIDEDLIYKEGDEYGREKHPHCTIKYGLTKSYTEEQIRKLIHHVIPFDIVIKGINIFESENYDVIKFDVDGPVLHQLREIFPN